MQIYSIIQMISCKDLYIVRKNGTLANTNATTTTK